MKEEIVSNTGSLGGEGRDPQPELREEQAGPYEVAERPVIVKTSGNTGRAKGP
jgi:hypothetical protein